MIGFKYCDPHIHSTFRTSEDYQAMAEAGITTVIEPCCNNGIPRKELGSFKDYFNAVSNWEAFRASQFGIRHYCTLGLHPKEILSKKTTIEVLDVLPQYLANINVVGIGEMGFHEINPLEEKAFIVQLNLAKSFHLPVQIYTPSQNKKEAVIRSIEICNELNLSKGQVIVEHANEEVAKIILDHGYKIGLAVNPKSRLGFDKALDIIKKVGDRSVIISSGADWGLSDPMAVPRFGWFLQQRGVSSESIHKLTFENGYKVFRSSGRMHDIQRNLELKNRDQILLNNRLTHGTNFPNSDMQKSML